MKKLIAMLVAIAMVMSFATSAFAEEPTTKLTITDVSGYTGTRSYEAHKILVNIAVIELGIAYLIIINCYLEKVAVTVILSADKIYKLSFFIHCYVNDSIIDLNGSLLSAYV